MKKIILITLFTFGTICCTQDQIPGPCVNTQSQKTESKYLTQGHKDALTFALLWTAGSFTFGAITKYLDPTSSFFKNTGLALVAPILVFALCAIADSQNHCSCCRHKSLLDKSF